MGELVRKELKSFFASLSGYVVLVFFLLANGLFLWVIPGGYHIPAKGDKTKCDKLSYSA